jgi:hypothetical protein
MSYEVQMADLRRSVVDGPTKQFKVVFRHGPQPWHCETVRYFRDRAKAEAYAARKNEDYQREIKGEY